MNKKLIAILVANLFAAAPAFAQSDDFKLEGSVGLGGIYVDDDDPQDGSKLNEYRDMSSGALAGFDIRGRGSRYWLEAFGENIARDDMYLNLRGGMYDVFKYRLYSDSLRHNFLYNGRTPYNGAGSSSNTATFPALNPATWNSYDAGYDRRDDGGFFEYQGLAPWYLRADANQVTTSGGKIGAASQGMSPGNGYVDLLFPVEYTTRNATFEGGYNTKTVHFSLAWMNSKFENDNETITWTNGYYGQGTDTTYLGPDNQYTRIAANATFRQLPLGSTLALRYTKDELESDATIGTSVLGSTAGAILATGPNVAGYNGNVENETFTFALASTPMKNLDTRIYWNYAKRDDSSTHVVFTGAASSGTPYENELFSYDKDNYGIDAYWRFNRENRIGAGWDYLDTERTRFDFDRTKDRKWFLEWRNSSFENVGARVKYQNLDRKSDFLLGNDGANANDVAYWNRFLKAYDAADMDQDLWKINLDFSPAQFLDISFEGNLRKNDFKDQVLGRLSEDRSEYYVSLSYGNPQTARFTVFGDWEDVKYVSRHRVVGSSTATTPPGPYDPNMPPTASNYNWEGTAKDENWAFGISLDWPATERLAVSASFLYYKTDGSVDFAAQAGPAAASQPQPIGAYDDAKRTSFNLKGTYKIDKKWTFTAGYSYEKYDYKDAQYDGYRYTIPASSNQNSYLNGYYAYPQYKANIIYGVVSYRF